MNLLYSNGNDYYDSLKTNLIEYLKLDGNSKSSLSGLLGIDTAVTYPNGKINTGANFNGTSSVINMNTDLVAMHNLTQMSFSLWINPTTVTGNQSLISKWDYVGNGTFELEMAGSGLGLFIANVTGDGGGNYFTTTDLTITANQWNHIVVVYNGSGVTDNDKLKFYHNGILKNFSISGGAIPTSLTAGTAPLRLGFFQGIGRYYGGMIDEVGVWSRILTPTEISNLYNSNVGLSYPFIKQSYKFAYQPNRMILDMAEGKSAFAAFSVRKLRNAYTGYCMRVRRNNDDTVMDIGFDNTGTLNVAQLLNFVGNNNGHVVTWYDQSGNGRNFSQLTNAQQPMIVNTGVLYTRNNKPTVLMQSTMNMSLGTDSDIGTVYSTLGMIDFATTSPSGSEWLGGAANIYIFYIFGNGSTVAQGLGTNFVQVGAIPVLNSSKSILVTRNNLLVSFFQNGTSLGSNSFSINTNFVLRHLAGENNSIYWAQKFIQETIIWQTDKTIDRSKLEENLNTFYK
jgi:hypothetical protein